MKKLASCVCCKNTFKTNEMVKLVNPKTHYSYICVNCNDEIEARSNDYHSYWGDDSNKTLTTGVKEKTISITFGTELETDSNMNQDRLKMLESYGWKATYDGSISGPEYKSPIFNNLNGLAKLLYSILDSEETGAGIPSSECGTHINVWSNELGSNDWQRIQNRYAMIFKPLYDEIMNDENHDELFGRKVNGWCNGFGTYHECLINMESNKKDKPRIEFRICKYSNNKQFMNAAKFCCEVMKTILVNYSRNYKTDTQCSSSYEATRHNDHKAMITANKLVKVYKKYRGL